jgi:hypothetical protein
VITWEIIYFGITPDFGEKYVAHLIEQARQSGASPEALARKQAEMARFAELYRNPAINAAITLLEPLPVGLVMSLISAGVLRRRRAPDPAPSGVVVV